jgi:hypothetical protein
LAAGLPNHCHVGAGLVDHVMGGWLWVCPIVDGFSADHNVGKWKVFLASKVDLTAFNF